MRLRRLDLARYGKFTDRVIDFGARVPDEPDLHIVYRPNEAGKSTAFSAFLDLLFGIEQRTPYNFLRPYPSMRIGAALELDGDVQEFVRIKRPKNSLLDGSGQPLADGALLGFLGARPPSLPADVLARRRNAGGGRRKHIGEQGRSRPAPVLG